MGLHQTEKFLHSKGNHQQNKKDNPLNGRTYLQIHLIRGQYPKLIKNLKKLPPKKRIQLKMGKGPE